jgi:hypothetical protein
MSYDWLMPHLLPGNNTECEIPYETIIAAILENIISKTRFGDRFFIEFATLEGYIAIKGIESFIKYKKDSAIDVSSPSLQYSSISLDTNGTGRTVTFNEMSPPLEHESDDENEDSYTIVHQRDLQNNSPLKRRLTRRKSYGRVPMKGIPLVGYPTYLTLDVSSYADTQMANVLTLIKARLNHPQTFFFFGGDSVRADALSDSYSNSSNFRDNREDHEKIELSSLPNYLALVINRKNRNSTRSSSCIVEMPLDMDLLFLLQDQRAVGETLYKLHGYTTYADSGKMVAIIRCREGKEWYRCLDMDVAITDPLMGLNRVRSRGVVFALYRLQEKIVGAC